MPLPSGAICNAKGDRTRPEETYRVDQTFALHVRMLYCMAYLPINDVPLALELVRATMPAAGQPLIAYFDRTYVNGPVLRKDANSANIPARRPPLFLPSMWNVSERFNQELPTTNNHVEAWHRRMNAIIVLDRPVFYTALHKLRLEQRHTEIQIARNYHGVRRKRQNRSIVERSKRLALNLFYYIHLHGLCQT